MSKRTEQVGAVIQEQIARLFTEQPVSHGVLLSVTRVEMTVDLGLAKIWIDILGADADRKKSIIEKMCKNIPHYRRGLTKRVSIKYMPQIRFYLDENPEYVDVIEEQFNKI